MKNVNTLHLKNLLHLGEDRYLTTLLTSAFTNYSLKFIIEARCETTVPVTWNVLVSQRRRWINSTIHNLFELVSLPSKMCGVFIFSMRFIVLLDLVSTVVLPASMIYLYYLIYLFATGQEKIQTLFIVILSIVYGIQTLIFVIKREYEYFGWLIIYIIAMPIWNIILPLYSFWKFDDFSWGKTRKIEKNGIELEDITSEEPTVDYYDCETYRSPIEEMSNNLDIITLSQRLEELVNEKYNDSSVPNPCIIKITQTEINTDEFNQGMSNDNLLIEEDKDDLLIEEDKDDLTTNKNTERRNSNFIKILRFWEQ